MENIYANIAQNNIIWHKGYISLTDRNGVYGHSSGLIWFTGLPSSGKSTIAHALEKLLFDRGTKTYVLDGDNVRHGLNADLGFSPEDRKENIRRIVELAKLMADAGILVLAAFVSPHREDRKYIRKRFEDNNFIEVYVKCSIEQCEKRDSKGHYQKARMGIIKNYTGISSPYDEPEGPDLILNTELMTINESVDKVLELLIKKNWIP